jgi:hypothetical protein
VRAVNGDDDDEEEDGEWRRRRRGMMDSASVVGRERASEREREIGRRQVE